MRRILITIAFMIYLTGCFTGTTSANGGNITVHALKDTLVKIWETAAELQTPECVYYDAANKVLYVSNMNKDKVDGDGFISKVSLDGKILALKWISGLNDPKGMFIYNNKLFVADNQQIIEIDILKGVIAAKYKAEDSKNLNDIAIDNAGTLYISDFEGNALYRLKNGKMERWSEVPELKDVNGMLIENNSLLIGTANGVFIVDKETAKLSKYIERTGFIDGISPMGNNRYLVSNWEGDINLIAPKQKDILIYSSKAQKINQADFTYIKKTKMVYSPTFFKNSVIAYKFK